MRKICFLKSDFDGGGTERVVSLLANSLAEDEEKFKVFVLDVFNEKKMEVFKLHRSIEHHSLSQTRKGLIGIIHTNCELFKFLKKKEIDVLISVQAMMGLNSIIPALFTKTSHIVWEHANYYQNQEFKLINLVRQIELLLVKHYIVLTKRDKQNFINNLKTKSSLDYIYNPLAKNSHPPKYRVDSKSIISAGHLTHIKGFDILIDVAKLVFEKHPDWNWHIYGEGPERENLERKIEKLNLTKRVILCGRSFNMEECYRNSSIYVLTSRMEGLPMVLLEAKAQGLPLVSFDIETGPNEIIQQGINGFLVENYDVKLMAESICKLIESSKLRLSFSRAAIDDINEFDINHITKEWKKKLDSI